MGGDHKGYFVLEAVDSNHFGMGSVLKSKVLRSVFHIGLLFLYSLLRKNQ